MKGSYAFVLLAVVAFVILGVAAVWLGGLNQDEGWYLYAAQMVAEGRIPYRDFFFTQGPVMPFVYSALAPVWAYGGLLGARIATLLIGLVGLVLSVLLARRLAPLTHRTAAGLIAFLALGCNLYHVYYLAIPKTYALASLFVLAGFYLLSFVNPSRAYPAFLAALALAFAAGTRISLGALLAVVAIFLLCRRDVKAFILFCVGGALGLVLLYGPFLFDVAARDGLIAAQHYHAARGGFDPVWTVGSLSRLIRWYLPLFTLAGLSCFGGLWVAPMTGDEDSRRNALLRVALVGVLAVFAVQLLAPFPYEDYQVPIMGLFAAWAAARFVSRFSIGAAPALGVLLTLGMTWALSFGSPLLEKWMTNGQDRFWSLKKSECEMQQLRDVAQRIETIDPNGKELLTQDLYLAIETRRRVPEGLEMGPFAILSDEKWRELLSTTTCPVAALSGYTFAILPPACIERPMDQQLEFWSLLKKRYKLAGREENFGQNATTLLILKRK